MKNVQQGAKSLAKMLGWLLMWSVIGYLLLVLAYSLPVGRMKDHLRSEESTFTDGYYMLVRNDTSTQVDNITDSIILAEAVYDGPENPWQKAAAAFYASPQENKEHSESYLRIQAAVEDTGPYTQYARYWHGYLIFLKSLLLLLDYRDILRLNMIVQLFFMLLLAMLLQRRGKPQLLLPLVLMFAALTPAVTGLCLQYVPCFLILCVTSTVILYKPEFAQKHSTLLFLSTGMLVAYFDFLTYPLVTLGVPLVLWLVLQPAEWKQKIVDVIRLGAAWGFGYVAFWAMKWLIGSLVLGRNVLQEAADQIAYRVSDKIVWLQIDYKTVLQTNLGCFNFRTWQLLLLVLVAVCLLLAFFRRTVMRVRLLNTLPYMLVAATPFVWYKLTENHSCIHGFFTHRDLAVTIFATACILVDLSRKESTL